MASRHKRNLQLFFKWASYCLVLLLGAILQTTPGFLSVGSVKPVFILPVCLAVSLCEGPWAGALFGAGSGLLWDLLAGRTVGLLAISCMLLCFGAAIVVQSYLQINHMNFVLISGLCCLAITSMDFLFNYVMRGYPGSGSHFWGNVMPICVFTAAVSPLVFWLIHLICQRLSLQE